MTKKPEENNPDLSDIIPQVKPLSAAAAAPPEGGEVQPGTGQEPPRKEQLGGEQSAAEKEKSEGGENQLEAEEDQQPEAGDGETQAEEEERTLVDKNYDYRENNGPQGIVVSGGRLGRRKLGRYEDYITGAAFRIEKKSKDATGIATLIATVSGQAAGRGDITDKMHEELVKCFNAACSEAGHRPLDEPDVCVAKEQGRGRKKNVPRKVTVSARVVEVGDSTSASTETATPAPSLEKPPAGADTKTSEEGIRLLDKREQPEAMDEEEADVHPEQPAATHEEEAETEPEQPDTTDPADAGVDRDQPRGAASSVAAAGNNYDMATHPACAVMPPLGEADLSKLADDIRVNGQLQDIVTQGGQIIDGRHRYIACRRLGLEPRFVEYKGPMSVEQYVWSANAKRRQATVDQMAMACAMLSALDEREAAAQRRLAAVQQQAARGKEGGRGRKKASPTKSSGRVSEAADSIAPRVDASQTESGDVRARLAAKAGISEYRAQQTINVLMADSELAKKVLAGEIKLLDAARQLRAAKSDELKPASLDAARKARKPASTKRRSATPTDTAAFDMDGAVDITARAIDGVLDTVPEDRINEYLDRINGLVDRRR